MDIFVYSDESGVFDKANNEIFVYGGLIFIGKDNKDVYARKYLHAERTIRVGEYGNADELKASRITNKQKGKLYRSLNNCIRFGVVINEKNVLDRIFKSKKDKQRYLDYAYKIGLKRAFVRLVSEGRINPGEIRSLHIFNDEHTTATNGKYELREALEQEFKLGTYNATYDKYFPPIFRNMEHIDLTFCDSKTVTLIRASDIVANKIYHAALNRKVEELAGIYVCTLP